jgi:catechol 2,3-dioxygenase-like lactoylglutathione lyase family enzyme
MIVKQRHTPFDHRKRPSMTNPQSEILFGTVSPQFIVPDVVATAEYYRDVLGFQIVDYFLDPPVHAIVSRGFTQVFFALANETAGVSNRALKPVGLDAYFRVTGLERLAEEFRGKGATILEGPVVRVYQLRELVVQDCNGFVLVFGEDVSK